MTRSERVYRAMLLAYPAEHRRNYGDPIWGCSVTACAATVGDGARSGCGPASGPTWLVLRLSNDWRQP